MPLDQGNNRGKPSDFFGGIRPNYLSDQAKEWREKQGVGQTYGGEHEGVAPQSGSVDTGMTTSGQVGEGGTPPGPGSWGPYDSNNPTADPFFEERRAQLERDRIARGEVAPPQVADTIGTQGGLQNMGSMVDTPITVDRTGMEAQTEIARRAQAAQASATDMWRAMAEGGGPSVAAQLLEQGIEQGTREQGRMQAGARKATGTAQEDLRGIQEKGAGAMADLTGKAGALRSQEQLRAMAGWQKGAENIVKGATTLRAQDQKIAELEAQIELARQQGNQRAYNELVALQAQLQNDRNIQQAQLDQQAQAQIDAMTQFYIRSGMDQEQANRAAMMDWARIQAGLQDNADDLEQRERESQRARDAAAAAASIRANAAYTAAGFRAFGNAASSVSDERAKGDKQPDDASVSSFFRNLAADNREQGGPMTWRYKEGMGPEGKHAGPMAQQLEKAGPIGQGAVKRDPDGMRRVDYGQLLAAMVAHQADLEDRLSRQEGRPLPISDKGTDTSTETPDIEVEGKSFSVPPGVDIPMTRTSTAPYVDRSTPMIEGLPDWDERTGVVGLPSVPPGLRTSGILTKPPLMEGQRGDVVLPEDLPWRRRGGGGGPGRI